VVGGQPWHSAEAGGLTTWRGFFWWPLPSSRAPADVPSAIRESFDEAGRALAAGCQRAAGTMARRTVEAICADQGVASGPLAKRMDELRTQGKLHATLADGGTAVRLLGNKSAHFDPIEMVETRDVAQLIAFEQQLLHFLYAMPAELRRPQSASP
jgi:uncharacterized protein DUF4145